MVRPVSTDGSRFDGPFDHDLLDATDPGPVLGQRRALDHDPEALEALADDGRVDGPLGCSASGAASVPSRGEKMNV